ncbi:MAG: S-layer homology domain-containing protein [Clostridiales Family XIII bacterium]|jgi:hypothetical protein|nr:S-layer homology domain-containing protein [Clostridiales Family XIII bacterium]
MTRSKRVNRDVKRAYAIFLVAALFAGAFLHTAPPSSAASNFVDTVGHWADDEIREAVDYGYVRGYANGRFCPDDPIKRSEFVKIINSAEGYAELGNIAFLDVPTNEWYYDEVRKAAAAGYISGYGNGEWFAPDNPITREEVATVLYRVAPGSSSAKAPKGLKDASDIGDWALAAVSSAYGNGYLTGYPDGNFYPKRNLTRAETVKVVNKLLGIDQDSRAITSIGVSDTTDSSTVGDFTSRANGTLYWLVIERGEPTPTPTQASQGRDGRGAAAMSKGNVKVTAFEPATAAISSLEPDRPYVLCAVLKPSSGKLSSVRTLNFSTVDQASIGENWIGRFSIGSVTQDSAVLTAQSSEKGTLYWVVTESRSSGRPSQTDIAGGKDRYGDAAAKSGSTALDRSVSTYIDITGLKSGNSYYVYGYLSKSADSAAGGGTGGGAAGGAGSANSFSRVESASFSTSGVSTPSLSRLTAAFNNSDQLEIGFSANDAGKFYWIAVSEDGSAFAPTADKVKAGSANTNQQVADRGSLDLEKSGAGTVTKAALSMSDPLQPDTRYRVYACFENKSGSLSSVVSTGLFEKSTVAGGLTGLSISAGGRSVSGFSFDRAVYEYSGIEVPNGSKTLTLRPVAGNSVDIIIDGRIAASNANFSYDMPQASGTPCTIVIETSEAGKSKTTYRVSLAENSPEPKSVYVSGAEPSELVKDGAGNYAASVPENYSEVTASVTFASEMTAAFIMPDGARVAARSGERKKLALSAAPAPTVVQIEIKGPTASGEAKTCTLTIMRTATTPPAPTP